MRSTPVFPGSPAATSEAARSASHGKRLARAALLAMSVAPLLVAAAPPSSANAKALLKPSTNSQHAAPPAPPGGTLPGPGAMALLASTLVLLGRLAHRLDPGGTTV